MDHEDQGAAWFPTEEHEARRAAVRAAAIGGGLAFFVLAVAAVALAWIGLTGASSSSESAAVAGAPSFVATTPAVPAPAPVAASATGMPAPAPFGGDITMAFVGDLAFSSDVARAMERGGSSAPLSAVAPLLAGADLTLASLESPLVDEGSRARGVRGALRGDPAGVDGLRLAGIDAVSLANDHALDYGVRVLTNTISTLATAGVRAVGAGEDRDSAWQPVVLTPRGAPVAFLAFSRLVPAGGSAGKTRAGVASAGETEAMLRAVRSAKRSFGRVVVAMHWGSSTAERPDPTQVRLAHGLVDAGADVVLGQGPHVLQPLEVYKGSLVAYSLGDFVYPPARSGPRIRSSSRSPSGRMGSRPSPSSP